VEFVGPLAHYKHNRTTITQTSFVHVHELNNKGKKVGICVPGKDNKKMHKILILFYSCLHFQRIEGVKEFGGFRSTGWFVWRDCVCVAFVCPCWPVWIKQG
jgi:hypothetical protein